MNIHFIGIGGIGVSALAQYYLAKGHKVSGSDLVFSEIIEILKKKGAKISIGKHNSKNLPKNADLIIYSPAVKPNNPELKIAKEKEIKYKSYPQALGKLTKKYFTIAVSGTHGKSTVTAMLSLVLIKAGLDPTVILGTKLKEFNRSNFRIGKRQYLIIEADEWQAAFLKYFPKIIVLTNIEREHLDYYKNLNHIIKTYREFVSHLPKEGTLVMNGDDKNIKSILQGQTSFVGSTSTYSLKQKETQKLKKILKIPGEHNVSNALAVLKTARILKIPDKISYQALSEYQGSWRRFEIKKAKINNLSFTVISDYAHHPTEVKATLEAVKEKFKNRKIWLVFQPHQYQRTFYLFKDFVKVLRQAPKESKHPTGQAPKESKHPTGQAPKKSFVNKIIITDIFDVAGRETQKTKEKVNSKKLVRAIDIPSVIYLTKDKIIDYLKKNLKSGEVVIIMGAGDIYKLAEQF